MKDSYEGGKALKAIKKAFAQAPAPRRKMTSSEIVAELYEDITAMREKGYPWEQIAELMGDTINLKPGTLRRYYGEAKKRKNTTQPEAPQVAPRQGFELTQDDDDDRTRRRVDI